MGNVIALVGKSGTGKTTSMLPNEKIGIKGLNPKETVFISVGGSGKPLLFPKVREHYKTGKLKEGANHIFQINPFDVATIIRKIAGGILREAVTIKDKDKEKVVIKTTDTEPEQSYNHIKNIVVDDAQFFQMFTFMDKITERGYDKFLDIGEAGYVPLRAAFESKRNDLNIIFTYHSEETTNADVKIKTAGKLIDQYLTIEGLFSFVLFTTSAFDFATKQTKYYFETQTNGFTTAKTPPGCFDSFTIPNDMGYVLDQIKEYIGE